MDSSKILEECSSSESGWTMYIASSPDHENDDPDGDDDDEDGIIGKQGCKKDADEDVDSDDSMASDASSGPSDLYGHVSRGFSHAGNRDERKYVVGKKYNHQQEEKKTHHEQIKAEKDKSVSRANSAGRSKKI